MKLFIWDFHGVLEKDNELAVLDISNQVLRQAGFKQRFTKADNHRLYGVKWYQYFEDLLPDLSHKKHLALQAACFKFAEKNLHILHKHIKPNDYVIEVLKAIKKAGHDQVILSNSRPADILWFVESIGIKQYFPDEKIIGVNAHERHEAKQDALLHYLKGKVFDSLVIIGDSKSDMELKNVAGGVSYFYNHPGVSPTKPESDYQINDLRKVLVEV